MKDSGSIGVDHKGNTGGPGVSSMHVVPCTKLCMDNFTTLITKCVQRGVFLHSCI